MNLYISKNYPISLVHFVTNKCNARCKHCFIDFNNKDIARNELTLGEIAQLTKNLGNRLYNVNLTGGEPFLREDIFDIVQNYIKNAKVTSVYITSNGFFTNKIKSFLDKYIASELKATIIISISIDNLEKEHDNNRKVNGIFTNALASYRLIENYKKNDIMSNIAITVTQDNYEKVVELYTHLKVLGVKSITATVMREEGIIKINSKIKKRILRGYEQLTELLEKDLCKKIGFNKKNIIGAALNAKNMISYTNIKKTYLTPKYMSHCPAAELFIVIHADGNVYPCEMLNHNLGNLRDYDMDLIRLLKNNNSEKCREYIKKVKCNCTYECAKSINIISNKRFIPALIRNLIKQL